MYEVLLERTVERDLKKLSAVEYHRIIPAIQALADNPRPVGSRKISGSQHDWRIRVGDYRVVYEIDDKAKHVNVMRARHRRDVYR